MDSEKDKVPVVEQPEVNIEGQPEVTVQEQPETTIKEQIETTIKEQPETTIKEQPETTVEIQPETTVKEQIETAVKEQPEPETIVENQPEASIEKEPETTVKETSENQNQNTQKVNELEEQKTKDLEEQKTNGEVKDLKQEEGMKKDKQRKTKPPLAEEKRVEDQIDPKETTKEETMVKSAIANEEDENEAEDEGEEKNIPTEISAKKKKTLSTRSVSIFSALSGDDSNIDSKSLRREIRAKKRKVRLELLQKEDSDEDSRFSDSSSDISSVHEERRLSNLLVLKESFISNTVSLGIDKMSEHLLDSVQTESVQRTEKLYSLSNRMDFIENFEDLPSLSSFSPETSDDEELINLLRKEDDVVSVDQGVFVNPLTGEIDSSSISSEILNLSIHEAEEFEEECRSCDEDIDIISIYHRPTDLIEIEHASKTFETFAALKKVLSEDEFYMETEEMILARQQRAMAYEFLYQLIDEVVEKGEIIDQNAMLARNLSKTKLFERLVSQLKVLVQEKLLNQELVRTTTNYYKRIKNYRYIAQLPLNIHETESLNYSNNLMLLDFMLKKENESLIHSYIQTDIASSHNAELDTQLEESENNLKKLILRTFGNSRLAIMKTRLENDLKVMAKKRAEISKARLALIQRQHIVAILQEKLAALEKISGTLTLSTFISKQTEVLKIDKKIEERYLEFKKLQFTFTSELDKLAHVKEKSQFMDEKIKKQQAIFDNLLTKNLVRRELLYKLKLEHSKIIHNIREKSFQSGLLERPALLIDYDNTTDELSIRNEKVLEIQKKMNILQSKIEETEEKLRHHGK